jgi:RHS repeat-associated protein
MDAKMPSGTTTYTYNNMDRLTTRRDPLLKTESYVYDNSGNLTQFTDRKGQITTNSYDSLNRRTQVTYNDGSSTTYTYDKGNRLTQIVDSIAGTITRTYDGLDRLTSEQTPQGTVGYTYDAASRRSTMTVPGQAQVVYTYDNANRLTQITQGSSIVQFGYDNANRRTSLTLPNAILVEYAYDAASRVTGITYKQNGTTLLGDLTYEYDRAGNRTKVGGSFARTGIPQSVNSANYNAANQQLTFGDKTLTYDNDGNLTSITDSNGTTLYSWNARNQLVSISGPNVNASFVYDGLGRRQKKTINSSPTEFLYDGVNPVQETSGATVLVNTLTGLAIDEFLSRTDVSTGITRNLLPDALGSTIALADAGGAVQTEMTYEPFGKTTATGASSSNLFQYTGRENDGTGLYYYRARYYHPELQRFVGEDPLGFDGGDINLYAYVGNHPANFVDPEGYFQGPIPLGPAVTTGLGIFGKAALGMGGVAVDLIFPSPAGGPGDMLPPSPSNNPNNDKCQDDDDCKDRIRPWELKRGGHDAHIIKEEFLGKRTPKGPYELCKCKNGEIAIRLKGCKGPIIRTGYRL